jgi:hypothetical protein
MPNLSELTAEAASLTATVEERSAASPEVRLAATREQLARFDILQVRRSGGIELLTRAQEEEDSPQRRSVLISLCRSWWDAVCREAAAAVGHLPDDMAKYTTALDDEATIETVRSFIAYRLLELERILA